MVRFRAGRSKVESFQHPPCFRDWCGGRDGRDGRDGLRARADWSGTSHLSPELERVIRQIGLLRVSCDRRHRVRGIEGFSTWDKNFFSFLKRYFK